MAMTNSVNSTTNNHFCPDFRFPKAELHCHLDGTFRLSTIIDLAKQRGVPLPSYTPETLADSVCSITRRDDLAHYLAGFKYSAPTFAGCKDAITRITREAIEDKAKDGVRYIEFRFAPHLLANCDVTPIVYSTEAGDLTPRGVVETVCEASEQAQKEHGIIVRLILVCIMSFPDWSMEVAKFCEEFADKGVVAIDIAGAPVPGGHEISDHIEAFRYCESRKIHITVHAGESGGADEVDNAMKLLHAQRIGHGYRVVEDEKVYVECKRRNVHFEVCPISSYRTASVDTDLSLHPAIRFLKEDVNFSLSSDDPGINLKTLTEDYEFAFENLKFSSDVIMKLNLNALRSAFCDPLLRDALCSEFEKAYKMKSH